MTIQAIIIIIIIINEIKFQGMKYVTYKRSQGAKAVNCK